MSTRILLILAAVVCMAAFAQEQKPEQKPEPKQPAQQEQKAQPKPPAQQEQKAQAKQPAGTEISADLGPCEADFKVTDLAGKPLYNAKIQTQVRYGFLGARKLDLEIGTDSNGLARFVKLPAQAKKGPMTFTVIYGELNAELSYDPVTNCHAEYVVPLGKGK